MLSLEIKKSENNLWYIRSYFSEFFQTIESVN